MGLFGPTSTSVALVDIGSASVGGALARMTAGKHPIIYYSVREPIVLKDHRAADEDMLEALNLVGAQLIKEGGPALRRGTGAGSVSEVLMSIGSPWQETQIRTQAIGMGRPFTFTRSLLGDAVAQGENRSHDRVRSGEFVIATLLNGYEIGNPFGKRVNRAELIILSSTVDKNVALITHEAVRSLFHTDDIGLTAFAPVSYTVLRDLYPHEKEYLVLSVTGESTDIALMKGGLLVAVAAAQHGLHHLKADKRPISLKSGTGDAEGEWIVSLTEAFRGLATQYALPRTVFLLTEDDVRDYLVKTLDNPSLHALWLSDDPLTVIPSVAQHLAPYVEVGPGVTRDLPLSLLSLFWGKETGLPSLIHKKRG